MINNKKSKNMSYLLNYKNWRAVIESAVFEGFGQNIQLAFSATMDETAKRGFSEVEKSEGTFVGGAAGAIVKQNREDIRGSIERIEGVKSEYDEDKENYNPLVSISATVKPLEFKDATGLKVRHISTDRNFRYQANFANAGTQDIHQLLATLSVENSRIFFEQIGYIADTSVKLEVEKEFQVTEWSDSLFAAGIDGEAPNFIQSINDSITIAPDDNLPKSFGGSLASGQTLTKFMGKDGYLYIQAPIYTFGGFVPQGGNDLIVSDNVTKVTVSTGEVDVVSEESLTNANEVFVVGKADYIDPKGGPAKLKTAIQTIFNKFKTITAIKVVGGASNEGGDALNKDLVAKRATAVATLIGTAWPELKAAVKADTTDFSKIQPAGGNPDPSKRTIYLSITGTKVETKEKTSTSVDLATSTFKKDLIIINEYLLTAKLDATQSSLYKAAKEKMDKEKSSSEATQKQIANSKPGYVMFIKSKKDPNTSVKVTVEKVENSKVFLKNPTEGGEPIPFEDTTRFVRWDDATAKLIAKEEKAKTKSGAAGSEDI